MQKHKITMKQKQTTNQLLSFWSVDWFRCLNPLKANVKEVIRLSLQSSYTFDELLYFAKEPQRKLTLLL